MIEEIDFETYLYVTQNKFQIFVFDKKKLKNLYNEELKVYNKFDFQDFNDLSKFLDQNIYKIEKLVDNFIKNIILIIEHDENFHVNIGIKKKNYENFIDQKFLKNILTELKDLFNENYQEYRIMHMIIENYNVKEKKNSFIVDSINSDDFCIEVNFISISNNLVLALDKVLEKYQVKICQYLCGNYIQNFLEEDNSELPETAYKIKNGFNVNEVLIVPKNIENKGFFERFFQLFS